MADNTKTKYYEFSLGADATVIVEAEEPTIRGGTAVAGSGRLLNKAQKSFEETIARIPSIINPIREQITKHVPAAESVQIEFGLKFSGEFGIVVAKSQGEANFKISFVWKGASARNA